MDEAHISRGFRSKRHEQTTNDRVPPGQYVTSDFPVLSAGPTPHRPLDRWDFSIVGDGRGHGLHGMRQRAEFCGGTLDAGPRPEGGFRVRATLPVESAP